MPPLISESAQNLVPIIPQNSPKFPMTSPLCISKYRKYTYSNKFRCQIVFSIYSICQILERSNLTKVATYSYIY